MLSSFAMVPPLAFPLVKGLCRASSRELPAPPDLEDDGAHDQIEDERRDNATDHGGGAPLHDVRAGAVAPHDRNSSTHQGRRVPPVGPPLQPFLPLNGKKDDRRYPKGQSQLHRAQGFGLEDAV